MASVGGRGQEEGGLWEQAGASGLAVAGAKRGQARVAFIRILKLTRKLKHVARDRKLKCVFFLPNVLCKLPLLSSLPLYSLIQPAIGKGPGFVAGTARCRSAAALREGKLYSAGSTFVLQIRELK